LTKDEWAFKSDGSYKRTYGTYPASCTIYPAGYVVNGKWKIDGNIFSMKEDWGGPYFLNYDDFDILTFNESTFVLQDTISSSWHYKTLFPGDRQGFMTNINCITINKCLL
jgi:hypothetical protein